ncbi:hypothetical protein HPB47_012153 [Ixodes persulcatus]|uniref:Uncharacterized protein n=1 Tax=Ixodes persulcatus TaxID=34615 RepID=A0AC60NUE7_IXOPE|nr:hypothetical protein HPB47_012153 [Ixodes persulcatus]
MFVESSSITSFRIRDGVESHASEGNDLDYSSPESDSDDEEATMMNIDTLPVEELRTSLRNVYRKYRRLKAVHLETTQLLEESSGKVERLEAALSELRNSPSGFNLEETRMKALIENGILYSPYPKCDIPYCSVYTAVKECLQESPDKIALHSFRDRAQESEAVLHAHARVVVVEQERLTGLTLGNAEYDL